MHILVTNDDGPPSNQSSPYIHSFVKTLRSAGHTVSVVLPHQQRSWIGKAHFAAQVIKPTYFRPGTLHQDDGTTHAKPLTAGDCSNDDTEEWVLVNSTPATAAQLGLFHFFQDRGPVDLVVSGPNYGRNTTSLFSLSSGTIGGAMEAAICRKRAIALSYAFFSRNHDPEIIAGASRISVKLIEHLMSKWDDGVDLYSVNVPLVEGVEAKKVFYTYALQNYWKSGSSFTEVEAEDGDDPAEKEAEIREQEELGSEKAKGEAVGAGAEIEKKHARHKHRHFTWTPNFSDVYQSVETSEPGNDGWAVKEGLISVTPLKANFMHVPGLQGELKLNPIPSTNTPLFYACINYQDPYTQPLILSALRSLFPSFSSSSSSSPSQHQPPYTLINSPSHLPTPTTPFLQISQYESLPFDHLLAHSTTTLVNAYIIRKALIRKHYLAHTVRAYVAKNPGSVLGSHVPVTVDFELDYAEFLDEALVECYELHESFARNEKNVEEGGEGEREWWILKPSMSDRGQGIRLFSSESELRAIFEEWEADLPDTDSEPDSEPTPSPPSPTPKNSTTTTNTNNPTTAIPTSQLRHFIAQPYIAPFLFPPPFSTSPSPSPPSPHQNTSTLTNQISNRKFHIRTYVLCTGTLRVYVYHEMLALFAAVPYVSPHTPHTSTTSTCTTHNTTTTTQEKTDMRPHLTNTCLQQCSSQTLVLPLHTLPLPPTILTQINTLTSSLFLAATAHPTTFQPLPNAFEVYGLDFLVSPSSPSSSTTDSKVYLLEVNAFPDFAQSGGLGGEKGEGAEEGGEKGGKEVIAGLWRAVIAIAVKGFFSSGTKTKTGNGEEEEEEDEEKWGMKKVLDVDLGRR